MLKKREEGLLKKKKALKEKIKSFFFNDTATTEIYTLSLHDALPIYDELVVSFIASTAVTTDASDGKVILPCTYQDGTGFTLGDFDNSTDWDVQQLGDTAFVANVETIIAAKKILQPFALGSMTQKCFISVEDNTA